MTASGCGSLQNAYRVPRRRHGGCKRSVHDRLATFPEPRKAACTRQRHARQEHIMSDASRSTKEGLTSGLIAGVLFATAETITAAAIGESPVMPFKMFASVVLGAWALGSTSPAVLVAGGAVHLALSAFFGLFYGIYNSALTLETRRSLRRQSLIGTAYGVLLWLVNFQVLARVLFRAWFLELPPGPQVVMHGLAFGLPLGLVYGLAERRVRAVQRPLAYGP